MLKQFLNFIKFYGKNRKYKIFLFILISMFAGILEFVGIGLVYPFLMIIINPNFISNTYIFQRFTSIIGTQNSFTTTAIIGISIVSIFLCKNLLMIFCIYLQNKFVINWKNDINKTIMNYYLNAPYKNLFDSSISEKIYNLTVLSAQTLETFIFRALIFCTNSITVFFILILMLIKFPTLSIFTIIFVAICMAILNKFFKSKTEVLAPKMLEYSLKNNNQIIENIKNLKEIKIFSAQKYFFNKFNNIQTENNRIIFKNTFYASIPPYLVEIILVISLVLLAGVITLQNFENSTKIIASYGLILAVIFRIAPSLNRIQISLNHMNASKNMIKKMNEEYTKNNFNEEFKTNNHAKKMIFNESIKFNNIDFSYKLFKKILNDITFEIKKGEFVGIIGLSGAGKTTLIDILMGLLPVDNGEIFVDYEKINDENIFGFRDLIGYVPQEMNLIDGSFKNNVAWGMDSDIDEKRIIDSLEKAQLLDFVNKNGGINAKIEGLSQGQKQRLMIARALYKNPEIIVLDEATSSLDVETENEITQMLTNLKKEKTIIVISHRLSTLKVSDKIIYLKDGQIADIGNFEELKNRHTDFENLINLSKI